MNVDKKENEEYNKENKVEEEPDDDINPEVDMQFNKNQKNFFRAQKDIQEGILVLYYIYRASGKRRGWQWEWREEWHYQW